MWRTTSVEDFEREPSLPRISSAKDFEKDSSLPRISSAKDFERDSSLPRLSMSRRPRSESVRTPDWKRGEEGLNRR